MIFEWPSLLWALLLVPVLALAYITMERRRRTVALTVARWSTNAHAAVIPRARRILPPALYFVALTLLIAAMARPVAVVSLPSLRDVIILAIDVSNSMLADDVAPTRLAAAQKAAREFIEEQPATTQIGVVAFAETALAVQRPTTNREDLLKAIDRLKPQAGTAVGGAILVSLQALYPKEIFEVKSPEEKEREAREGNTPPPKAAAGLGEIRRDCLAQRRRGHRRAEPGGSRATGGGSRRARVHRGAGHQGGRGGQARRHFHARADRRGDAEENRRRDAGALFHGRQCRGPARHLPRRQHAPGG